MLNIAIVDDLHTDRLKLIDHLNQYAQSDSLSLNITSYQNGEEFISDANLSDIDVLFLDIFMEKLNGLQVAEYLRQGGFDFPVVFLSTSKAFALKSYSVRAFDYIIKPIDSDKVSRAMNLLLKAVDKRPSFIVVKVDRNPMKVLLSDIVYIDHHNHYVQIHTHKGFIRSYQTFSEFEKRMAPFKHFLTCYRCIMINMDQVEKQEKESFLMKNGELIPIQRKRSKEVKAQYFNYIFGEMENSFYE